MRIQNILAVLFSLFLVPAFSQPMLITCSNERNQDNSISIYADSHAQGEYTVKLIFSALVGYTTSSTVNSSNISVATVYRGRREIMRLTPVKSANSYALQYRFQYFPGTAQRKKPDTSFTYLLPGNEGIPLRILKVSSIVETIGQKVTDDFSATGFIYRLGDTICAARAGTVYDCSDEAREGEKGAQFYSKTGRNKIYIQHKDGTLAHYSVLAPIQLLVAAGDNVVPGQPLAVFHKESEKYHVLFSVMYLDEKKAMTDNTTTDALTPAPSPYLHVHTLFYIDENNKSVMPELNRQYTSAHPKELIGTELSKKDKKKLGL
jgi:hypothetical protein